MNFVVAPIFYASAIKSTEFLLTIYLGGTYFIVMYLEAATVSAAAIGMWMIITGFTVFSTITIAVITVFKVEIIITWLYKVFKVSNFTELIKSMFWGWYLSSISIFVAYLILFILFIDDGDGGPAAQILESLSNPETGPINIRRFQSQYTEEEQARLFAILEDSKKDETLIRVGIFSGIVIFTSILVAKVAKVVIALFT